jgi:hypothetical protein
MRHPHRSKRPRGNRKFVMRVREARASLEDTKYRVRVPMEIKQADPKDVRDMLLEALRTLQLESRVSAGDNEVAVTIEVEAADEGAAKQKALYWIKRAADKSRRLSFTGAGIGTVTVEEAG